MIAIHRKLFYLMQFECYLEPGFGRVISAEDADVIVCLTTGVASRCPVPALTLMHFHCRSKIMYNPKDTAKVDLLFTGYNGTIRSVSVLFLGSGSRIQMQKEMPIFEIWRDLYFGDFALQSG